jgi:hypothetical protein
MHAQLGTAYIKFLVLYLTYVSIILTIYNSVHNIAQQSHVLQSA